MAFSILVLGAGRSSSALINYLAQRSQELNATITVGDISFSSVSTYAGCQAIFFDIKDIDKSRLSIRSSDLVISMIPAHLHPDVARICLEEKKHLFTASYVSDQMRSFHDQATASKLLFLNECGLDPGIDHMSAKQVIDKIHDQGGSLVSFESFTGGLIAPETDPENPWRYKFTWNPRNVVMAGQGTAKFLQNGSFKFIPYQQLFRRITPVTIPGHGSYEGYANRDSLKYIETYNIAQVQTMVRGTLRFDGFCKAWDIFVQLGCTDDSYLMDGVSKMTHRKFLDSFLEDTPGKNTREKLAHQFALAKAGPELTRIAWSGLFDDEPIGLDQGTPAQILEHILNKKWRLNPQDRDWVAMWHRFVYQVGNKKKEIQSSLVTKGDDHIHTAMAKTVGLPLGITAKLLIQGKIKTTGVAIPVLPELYNPVLAELKTLGVELSEREVDL